jgi:hypothetical protein
LLEKGSLLRALAREAGKRSVAALFGSLKDVADCFVDSLRNRNWAAECFAAQADRQIRLDSS